MWQNPGGRAARGKADALRPAGKGEISGDLYKMQRVDSERCFLLPECKAKFEKHVGAFAGSVHWEDEVRIRESPRTKKRKIIVYSVILALVIAFWLLVQTGALGAIMEEIGWRYVRMVYPADRYASAALFRGLG